MVYELCLRRELLDPARSPVGTRMAAVLANPRNSVGGITGMAYRANLVVYRVGNTPLISSTAIDAVIDAYEDISQRQDIDVASMSMGSNTPKSGVNDAVSLAYGNGKLIFCAAGSGGFEVHPAKSAKVETIAVTGVSNNSPSHTNLTEAQGCGTGAYVDFSMFTEETTPSGARYGLSTKMQQGDEITWSKQSSHATALCAGIAASAWSVDPNFNRAQVLGFLQTSRTKFSTSLRIGAASWDRQLGIPLGLVALWGRKQHHLEGNLGAFVGILETTGSLFDENSPYSIYGLNLIA